MIAMPGDAGDAADDLGELDVHLLQGLLHVLDVVRGVTHQRLPLPPVPPQGQDRLGRAERRAEQAAGVESLQPLAVEPIGLGPGPAMAGLAGLDEEDLEATGFEQLEEGDPVDAGGFEHDRGDAGLREPIGQGGEVGRVGAEGADLLGSDAGDVVIGVDVDARGVGVDDRQGRGGIGGLAATHGEGSGGLGAVPSRAERGPGTMQSPRRDRREAEFDTASRVTNDGATASRAKLTCGQRAPGKRRPGDSRRRAPAYRAGRVEPPRSSPGLGSRRRRRYELTSRCSGPRPHGAVRRRGSRWWWPGPLRDREGIGRLAVCEATA